MAAITCSMDPAACRYAAAVETNGERVEMITKVNLKAMLVPLFSNFCRSANGCPQHIYYFRDGVSEGQFAHVLDQEVTHMKEALLEAYEDPGRKATIQAIKWTVVVCTKRHHIRFFPSDSVAGDKNGNPLPGVLVEQDITHPFEYDFYLNSHAAIQGTSRPVHYQVIRDERGVPPHVFQTMVYHHCYQYMRSTTPVSLRKSHEKQLLFSSSNMKQTPLSTMLTWLLIVLSPMRIAPLLMVLVPAKSLRKTCKIVLSLLQMLV